MNGSESNGLRLATVAVLALLGVVLLMNTCAMDRLEKQVIRQTKALENMTGGGGSLSPRGPGRGTTAPLAATSSPGEPSGVEAMGWGGRRAEILHVEGAATGAPLLIADKPRPQGDWYVTRRNSPPSTLNYYGTNEGETSTITSYCLGRLLGVDPDAPPAVVPSLAIRWEVSDDKLTYTYHLRRGVQFADGRPFTSADVKFSFDTLRDPAVQSEHMRSGFDDVDSVQTPDPQTVVVKYRKKYWKGVYTVGFMLRILNKGWYEEQIPAWAAKLGVAKFAIEPGQPGFGDVFNRIPIPCPGTTAYYYATDEYDLSKPVELVQNPFYWGIQVYPDWYNFKGLRFVFISDDVAAFEEFRKQKFDLSVVDFNAWDDQYSKDETIAAMARNFEYDHTGIGSSYIAWNCRKPPFDDARVRRAMTSLLDRAWILKEIERGRGTIATCWPKSAYPSYSKDIVAMPHDIAKAKALLAEAGWIDSDGDGVLDKGGKRFEFELKYGSARRFYVQVGSQLEDACKKAGIRMGVRQLEWATFRQDYDERRFDAVMLYGSFADPWIDPYEDFHSSQDVPRGGNLPGWRNPEADRLLEAMREEFDEGRRDEMFHRFNHVFDAEQPMTLITEGRVGVLINNRFEGIRVRPTGMQIFDFWVKPEKMLYK